MHPRDTIDNYVRFTRLGDVLESDLSTAGVVLDDYSTIVKAVNNIYRALDTLLYLGLPPSMKLVIKRQQKNYLVTSVSKDTL